MFVASSIFRSSSRVCLTRVPGSKNVLTIATNSFGSLIQKHVPRVTQTNNIVNFISSRSSAFRLLSTTTTTTTTETQEFVMPSQHESNTLRGLSVIELETKAKEGNIHALVALGQQYLHGSYGTPLDQHQAYQCFMRAADAGSNEGLFFVGSCLLEGHGCDVNIAGGLEYLQKSAEKKNPSAFCALGKLYTRGRYVTQDLEKGIHYFEEAVRLNHSSSNYLLGLCYSQGKGVTKDLEKAYQLFKTAGELGFVKSWLEVSRCLLKGLGVAPNPTESFEVLMKVYNLKRTVDVCFRIGIHYQKGLGVTKDKYLSFQYFKEAVDLGLFQYCAKIGGAFRAGNGTPKDVVEAERYYRLGIEKNNCMISRVGLAHLLFENKGVSPNFKEAKELLQIAVDANYGPAFSLLAMLYRKGFGVERNYLEAIALLRRGVDLKDPSCQNSMAFNLEHGYNGEKDLQRAKELYKLSAASGDRHAKIQLNRLSKTQSEPQPSPIENEN